MGATNLPHELDDAVLRRFTKRVYIPLPDAGTRRSLLESLLTKDSISVQLSDRDMSTIVRSTEGYSCADIRSLCQVNQTSTQSRALICMCQEAAMMPVREISNLRGATPSQLRPLKKKDFLHAIDLVHPSVSPELLLQYAEWENSHKTR